VLHPQRPSLEVAHRRDDRRTHVARVVVPLALGVFGDDAHMELARVFGAEEVGEDAVHVVTQRVVDVCIFGVVLVDVFSCVQPLGLAVRAVLARFGHTEAEELPTVVTIFAGRFGATGAVLNELGFVQQADQELPLLLDVRWRSLIARVGHQPRDRVRRLFPLLPQQAQRPLALSAQPAVDVVQVLVEEHDGVAVALPRRVLVQELAGLEQQKPVLDVVGLVLGGHTGASVGHWCVLCYIMEQKKLFYYLLFV